MAFGIKKEELMAWKRQVARGEIAILTHYWLDKRFPGCTSVTKVGCSDLSILKEWGRQYELEAHWIHLNRYPHFDLFGKRQKQILLEEGMYHHIKKFNL